MIFNHGNNCLVMLKTIDQLRVALVCMAKNEDNTITEWFSYHKKLGFDKIFMYENDWQCALHDVNLHKIRMNGKNKILHAYANWIKNYKNNYDYVCFLDCDEFIVLKQHENIKKFIYEYRNPSGISMNWMMFGSGGQINCEKNKNSLLKRFLYRGEKANKHIKCIFNTRKLHAMASPHHSTFSVYDTNWNIVDGPFNLHGPTNVVQVNHYFYKSYEEWLQRLQRGQADLICRKKSEWHKSVYLYHSVKDKQAHDWFYNNERILI